MTTVSGKRAVFWLDPSCASKLRRMHRKKGKESFCTNNLFVLLIVLDAFLFQNVV